MADTIRSLSDLLALLPSSGRGEISAADLRDMLVSIQHSRGSFSISSASATTISVAGTYYKAAGTTAAGRLHNFTHANNRVTYTGIPDVDVDIYGSLSMTTAGSNNILGMKMAKNGTVIDETIVRRKVGTGTDIGAAGIEGEATLSTNDYIELFVTNEDDTTSVTIEACNIIVNGSLT